MWIVHACIYTGDGVQYGKHLMIDLHLKMCISTFKGLVQF